jgi:hypothetical protein
MIDLAKMRMDTLEELRVMIDDKTVTPERIRSDVFKLVVGRNIPEHIDPLLGYVPKIVKGKYNAVIDGYWLLLKPDQDCKIHSFTSCKTGVLSLNVNHQIKIG